MTEKEIDAWLEAIDETINRHKLAIEENISYREVLARYTEDKYPCVLCKVDYMFNSTACENCLWTRFTGENCLASTKYNYNNNEESIKRLKEWKEKLKSLLNNSNTQRKKG